MAYGLTVAASVATASVTVTATGGVPGDTYYVMRRDDEGTHVLRDASDGIVWPASGGLSVVDYEATQSGTVDYLLTDVDGVVLATATGLAVPLWGSWLKAPTLPTLNVRVALAGVGPVASAPRREVYAIEGSDLDVVLSAGRGSRRGSLLVLSRDPDTTAAVRDLLRRGGPILVDVDPAWGVVWRYVEVGDVVESRPSEDDGLGLDYADRHFALGDLVEVPAPLGPTVVSAGWTYEALSALYGSYAALAAAWSGRTYTDLAAGE